jgi:hypothetical protein
MEQNKPAPRKKPKPSPPKWNSPIWYLPLMLLLVWFWQNALVQFTYRPIGYSEFKEHLRRREVLECTIKGFNRRQNPTTDGSREHAHDEWHLLTSERRDKAVFLPRRSRRRPQAG